MAQLEEAAGAEPPLFVVHVDSERGFSGGEVQVFLLMEGLRALGHRVALVCPPESRSEEACRERGIECHAVRMRNDLDWRGARGIVRVLRELRPDLVHLHTGRANWLGGLAARRADVPAVTTRRMDREVKRGWRTRKIYGELLRRAIAISPGVAHCLAEGGVPTDRTVLIPEALDPERVLPRAGREATRAALGLGPDEVLLLGAGALVRRKGFDLLLEAFRGLPASCDRAVLRIAGAGEERAALEGTIAASGLNGRAVLVGALDGIADVLAACDVFVMPSRREGLGVASLEAMGAGRAVVASRVGGLGHVVVDGETGLLVEPEDVAGLRAALERLIVDDDLRRRLGAAGPERVAEHFSAAGVVGAHVRLYREVLTERVSA